MHPYSAISFSEAPFSELSDKTAKKQLFGLYLRFKTYGIVKVSKMKALFSKLVRLDQLTQLRREKITLIKSKTLRFSPAAQSEQIVFGSARPGYRDEQVSEWIEFMRHQKIQRICCLLFAYGFSAHEIHQFARHLSASLRP